MENITVWLGKQHVDCVPYFIVNDDGPSLASQ